MNFSIFKRTGRKFYEVQWKDPTTGKDITRTTKQATYTKAVRWVGKNEDELLGRTGTIERITWEDFRERYEDSVFLGLAETTKTRNRSTFNKFEEVIDPKYLESVNDLVIEKFNKQLHVDKLQPFTIRTHLMILRKALNWAHKKNLLRRVPEFEFPRNIKGVRGRVITAEEFERMKKKVPIIVGEAASDSWTFLLDGLWWGGLRIGEAMALHWTDNNTITMDWSGKFPMFQIPAHAQKNRKTQLTPMAREFAELISDRERKGFVFNPAKRQPPYHFRITTDYVGKIITKIGKKANVKVSELKGVVKYASAHDLRRSFGDRWSRRVKESTLMAMMRHESIETTKKFYAKDNVIAAAEDAWNNSGIFTNTFTNTLPKSGKSAH